MELIELKESLSELKSIEDNLRSTLQGNLNYQKQTRIRIAELESGLKINDRVKVKFMGELKEGVITGYDTRYSSVYPIVTMYKKDGSLGTRTTSSYYKDIQSL